jgi:DNA-binding response OmpR family regulator
MHVTPDRRTPPPPGVDVLLVEDDAVTSTLVVNALHERHLTTDVAGDVVEAKRLLSRGAYMVVVVDLLLADGSGSEVIDFIKGNRLTTAHVVVVTAASPSLLESVDRSIVKTLFFKPLNIEHFASYVQTLAGRR